MKKTLFTTILAVAMFYLAAPAYADHGEGEVNAVLVQIQTKDGLKWFKLGENAKPVELKAGDYVHFDYADDTIEELEVEEPASEKKQE